MKKLIYSILFSTLLFTGCSDSDTAKEEFEEANDLVTEKLIETITIVPKENPEEALNIELFYNENGTLSSISDGENTVPIVFTNGSEGLTSILRAGESLSIEEVLGTPYDAFGSGGVTEYDANGNPISIVFSGQVFNEVNNSFEEGSLTAMVGYDDAPNPYFYTLQATGILDLLDVIALNTELSSQVAELINTRQLFPVNNVSSISYANEEGVTQFSLTIEYVYDTDNYPTSASVIANDVIAAKITTYTIDYTYVD